MDCVLEGDKSMVLTRYRMFFLTGLTGLTGFCRLRRRIEYFYIPDIALDPIENINFASRRSRQNPVNPVKKPIGKRREN